MLDIDEILRLMDSRNPKEVQLKGIEEAKLVKTLSVFVQPKSLLTGMETWANCAIVLYKKSDKELEPVLFGLFRWLKDSTVPGALTIAKRLSQFEPSEYFETVLNMMINEAQTLKEDDWCHDIEEFVNRKDFSSLS